MVMVRVVCDVNGDDYYVYIKGGRRLRNMIKLRLTVRWWVEQMEKELRLNESKGGWEDGDYDYLLDKAKRNLREIKTSKLYGMNPKPIDINYVIKCCADCSNFCMMLADNVRELIKNKDKK